jgi:poly-gamma-glutamate capsule biosynthesis protein CapA/YwtB (metallophosphatase superfamily)
MDSHDETSERFSGIGPQTAAARGGARIAPESEPQPKPEPEPQPKPEPEPQRTPEPEPQRTPGEISVRRLAEPQAPTQAPPAPTEAPPTPTRERVSALLALGSAVGVVAFFVASLTQPGAPTPGATFEATPASRAVAPGGRIVLTGSEAPGSIPLVLETRSRGARWRPVGRATSDDGGGFRLEGRVVGRPGPIAVRARAPGLAVAAPVRVMVRPLRLASVGDINLGDVPGAAIAANGPRWPWESAGRWLRGADIAFGNLESAVSTRGTPFPKQFNFRGTPAALAGLRRHSGIDVLNLANNHVGDYGPQATLDTVRGVERLGMKAVGAGPELRRALAPQVVERMGLRVAFVGFSNIAPVEFAATESGPGTAWATPESIASAVRAARRQADIVVATFHWGIEKQTLESADQRALADVAVNAGAQLVIGAHPHTLQPVRRQGAALVAYSLGNFVFGAYSSDTSTTGILEVDLTAEGATAARWRAGDIADGRPLFDGARPRRLPMGHDLTMETGVNLTGPTSPL